MPRPRSDSAALEASAEARDTELVAALFCARARGAWALKQHALAHNLLGRASDAAARVPAAVAAAALERVAGVYLDCGRALLANAEDAAGGGGVPLLQAAHERAAAAHAAAPGTPSALRLLFKALQCLAVAHLKAGAHDDALTCARALAALAASDAAVDATAAAVAGRAAQFLCINALCGLGRADEAAEHLAAAAGDAAAATELLAEAATAVLRAGRADAAAAVASLLAAGGAGCQSAALRFRAAALADDAGRAAAMKLLDAPGAAAALKGETGGTAAGAEGAATHKRLLHLQALLWNSATQLFEAKDCACPCAACVRCMRALRHCARLAVSQTRVRASCSPPPPPMCWPATRTARAPRAPRACACWRCASPPRRSATSRWRMSWRRAMLAPAARPRTRPCRPSSCSSSARACSGAAQRVCVDTLPS